MASEVTELEAWVDARLAACDVERTGPLELVRERPWSTIRSAATTAGTAWLKQVRSDYATEIVLYPILAEVVPEQVLVPYAVDPGRGLVLLPDGGEPIGHRLDGARLGDAMTAAVRCYAGVQQALTPHAARAVAAGVPDMRPAALPGHFDEIVEATRGYAATSQETQRTWDRVRALRPRYGDWCAELADSPIEASVDHNDLHPNSVLGEPPDDVRFLDWGDACVAHPFASLLFALEAAAEADRADLRDAYLGRWGAPVDLRPTADLAVRVAHVARALVWRRAFGDVPPDHPHAGAPLAQLSRMLPG